MPFLPWILLVALDVYAIYSLWTERASLQRTAFWLAVIFFIPAIGAITYLLFFRRPPAA
jgi:hypothetical protein